MKTIKLLTLLAIFIGFSSCSSDDDDEPNIETQWFADLDGDGLGDANDSVMAIEQPEGYVANSYDNDDSQVALDLISGVFSNLFAPQVGGYDQMGNPLPTSGEFIKFDFSTRLETMSETDWDIAFRGTSIIVNGGDSFGAIDEPNRTGDVAAYFDTGTLAGVELVDTSLLEQDSTNGYVLSDWYDYNPGNHIITPTAGKILVIKTRDGNFAKVEILGYYKDAPAPNEITTDIATNDARYYTFNYVYQPNEGVPVFQ